MRPKVPHNERRAKKRTTKIVDRLTYSPKKHKKKEVREMKKKLQAKEVPKITPSINSQTLKFGTFNINGLDLEAGWAVEKLITNRGIDVSIIHNKLSNE